MTPPRWADAAYSVSADGLPSAHAVSPCSELDVDRHDDRSGPRQSDGLILEVQRECFTQVRQRFCNRVALAGYIHLDALSDIPPALRNQCCGQAKGPAGPRTLGFDRPPDLLRGRGRGLARSTTWSKRPLGSAFGRHRPKDIPRYTGSTEAPWRWATRVHRRNTSMRRTEERASVTVPTASALPRTR
jgi:hypothetical protein